MDDFERKVQTMLQQRVVDLEPTITGPAVRAEARRRRPRSHQPLMAAAAAAVIAVAIVPILLSRRDSTPVLPGSPSTGTSRVHTRPPSTTPSPVSSPDTPVLTALPSPVGPSGTGTDRAQPPADGVPQTPRTTGPSVKPVATTTRTAP